MEATAEKTETNEEQKMEVDIKKEPVEETVEAEKPKVEEEKPKPEEEKPKPENEKPNPDVPMDTEEKKEEQKIEEPIIKVIPKGADEAYLLTVDEADITSVEGEEGITMTAEEVRNYIEKGVFDHIINNNPMDVINSNSGDLMSRMKDHRDEFEKLVRLIGVIEKDQLRYLRTDKKLRQSFTKTGGVGVDLPVLANSIQEETVLKRGFVTHPVGNNPNSTAKILTATPKPKVAAPAPPQTAAAKPVKADIECIDLTDETETPAEPAKKSASSYSFLGLVKHPAPLPPKPFYVPNKNLPPIPPKPRLKISSEERGIVLQWDMMPNTPDNRNFAPLSFFDIFGYQEQKNVPINTLLWKKIGSVKAMTLPMACTLTQFIEGNKYHFAVRAVDVHERKGFYSDPITITYTPKGK